MSADAYTKCPFCDKEVEDSDDGNVRIDGLYDYHLSEEGKIICSIRGECDLCGRTFTI